VIGSELPRSSLASMKDGKRWKNEEYILGSTSKYLGLMWESPNYDIADVDRTISSSSNSIFLYGACTCDLGEDSA